MKVLCVIDMQNDFIDGVLGTKEAEKIVDGVVDYINNWDSYIVATMDTHQKNYLETNEGIHLPIEHCIENTKGWEINEKVKKALGNTKIIKKPIFCLTTEEWKNAIPNDVEEITLIGLCTDICVITNALALKTAYPNIQIRVVESLCAGVTPKTHECAIETMKMCQVEII